MKRTATFFRNEYSKFYILISLFLAIYFFPLNWIPIGGPLFESLALVQWYAREHVVFCLVPAFFIAGAISVFLSQASVIKYFGPGANKFLSYGVASVSGSILAVCSCTILPLFSGIYKRGAGLGPATAFLYSGPSINILAVILTARILGWRLGLARIIGAIFFSIVIGVLMFLLFRREDQEIPDASGFQLEPESAERPLWKNSVYFAAMIGILIFANWGRPGPTDGGFWFFIHQYKWLISAIFLVVLLWLIWRWFQREEISDWISASWGFAKQILPLLFLGVLAAGLLLGRPGETGLIPTSYVQGLVGGNSILANVFASIVGAFMYFATLTEVPILEGLIGAGMGQGPALALLLAGPALSLPNMLVIRGVLGTKKTLVYILLVVLMASLSGIIYGTIV